jgi:hypothetical protein
MHEIPALRTFSDQLLSRSFEAGQRRIFTLISSPAEAKFLNYPLFNRIPLHMVASYLANLAYCADTMATGRVLPVPG